MTITVKQCVIYPLKSAGGISVDEIKLTARGFENDRLFMLVDDKNNFVTQRDNVKMAQISTKLDENGLHFSTPDGRTLTLTPDDITADRIPTTIWKEQYDAHPATAKINQWFSDYLGQPVKLVRIPDDVKRPATPQFSQPGDAVAFSDMMPLLVASTSSLDALTPYFTQSVSMDRFRANLILEGAFAEDTWYRLKIGDTEIEMVKHCARCIITTIDQTTGEKSSLEPFSTLKKYRHGGKGAYFGEYAIPRALGTIKVGDEVTVLATKPLDASLEKALLNVLHPKLVA